MRFFNLLLRFAPQHVCMCVPHILRRYSISPLSHSHRRFVKASSPLKTCKKIPQLGKLSLFFKLGGANEKMWQANNGCRWDGSNFGFKYFFHFFFFGTVRSIYGNISATSYLGRSPLNVFSCVTETTSVFLST